MLFNNNWIYSYESPMMWEGFRKSMLMSPISPDEDPEDIKRKRNEMIDVFRETAKYGAVAPKYLITGTAMEEIKKIKVDNIDMKMFRRVPDVMATFIIDRTSYYRIVRIRHADHFDQIWVAKVFTEKTVKQGANEAFFDIFSINLEDGLLDSYNSMMRQKREHAKHLQEYMPEMSKNELLDMEDDAIRIMIYLYLSELEFEFLPAGRKSISNGKKVVNKSKLDVTLVDSKWNTQVIRGDGFDVNGHLRLQPYGEGRNKTKLIWIDKFRKHGYTRHATRTK